MTTAAVIFIVVAYTGLLLFTARALIKVRSELDSTTLALHMERKRRWKTEDAANTLVVAVTPLIEKTNWMSGSWHGQFSTLVSLENKRNEAVDKARKAIWDIPLVADHIRISVAPAIEVEDHTK